jgi:predicted HicB family RNase H-like nuclease
MDKITVSLRIDKDLIIKLREMAAADERSLNYLVNKILLEAAVKSKNKTQP